MELMHWGYALDYLVTSRLQKLSQFMINKGGLAVSGQAALLLYGLTTTIILPSELALRHTYIALGENFSFAESIILLGSCWLCLLGAACCALGWWLVLRFLHRRLDSQGAKTTRPGCYSSYLAWALMLSCVTWVILGKFLEIMPMQIMAYWISATLFALAYYFFAIRPQPKRRKSQRKAPSDALLQLLRRCASFLEPQSGERVGA
jgi:hypothetical protein